MRGAWKIAALCAGWAALGLAGCAGDAAPPGEAIPATAALEAESGEEIQEEGAAPEARMSLEWTGEAAQEAQVRGPRRPPLCRRSHLVQVGNGYICRIGDLFPDPVCPHGWSLITMPGRFLAFMCERQLLDWPVPHPLSRWGLGVNDPVPHVEHGRHRR